MRKIFVAIALLAVTSTASAGMVCNTNSFGTTTCYNNGGPALGSNGTMVCNTNSFGTTTCY